MDKFFRPPEELPASQEFVFKDSDFNTIVNTLYQLSGIVLKAEKKTMVYARLSKRLRELGLKSFAQYCERLNGEHAKEELGYLVNALTTNLTNFFREQHHFDFLKDFLTAQLQQQRNGQSGNRLRIWSAGCSTGEEPYSMSMVMNDLIPTHLWDAKILATDIDTNVLKHAQKGLYRDNPLIGRLGFQKYVVPQSDGMLQMKPELQKIITFKQLNLHGDWPFSGPFDIIFCRNVVIYFDKETQTRLFGRFLDYLKPGGYLIIGHSETILGMNHRIRNLGKTIYQKVE